MASNVESNGGGSKYLYYLSGFFSARACEASAIQPSTNSRSWESRPFTPAALHDWQQASRTLVPYAAKRLRVMRCLLSECNCSLFVGLTHAGRRNVRRPGDVEKRPRLQSNSSVARTKNLDGKRHTGPVESWTHTEHILHHESNQRPPPEPRESQIDVLSCNLV